MTKEEIDQVLTNAERALDTHGWCRGVLCNDTGEVCALGAIDIALNGEDPYRDKSPAERATWKTQRRIVQDRILAVTGIDWLSKWNDHKAHSKEEVQSLFRKVRGD